ncbi:MAG: hypothetical protein CFE30_06165 [Bradyrhizobium sp. PARBB1]|nr:MAG: hypothetical protein CFE30_06165 [Bradyrhizobium sp. PARBB1]
MPARHRNTASSPATGSAIRCLPATKAFSSEVDTGSREENASKQESRAPFRFNRNGIGSRFFEAIPAQKWLPISPREARHRCLAGAG